MSDYRVRRPAKEKLGQGKFIFKEGVANNPK